MASTIAALVILCMFFVSLALLIKLNYDVENEQKKCYKEMKEKLPAKFKNLKAGECPGKNASLCRYCMFYRNYERRHENE